MEGSYGGSKAIHAQEISAGIYPPVFAGDWSLRYQLELQFGLSDVHSHNPQLEQVTMASTTVSASAPVQAQIANGTAQES